MRKQLVFIIQTGGTESNDFLIARQVASLFKMDQETFFTKYSRLWRRQVTPNELEYLGKHLCFFQDETPAPFADPEEEEPLFTSNDEKTETMIKNYFCQELAAEAATSDSGKKEPVLFIRASDLLPRLLAAASNSVNNNNNNSSSGNGSFPFPFRLVRLALKGDGKRLRVGSADSQLVSTVNGLVNSTIKSTRNCDPLVPENAPPSNPSDLNSGPAITPQERVYVNILSVQRDRIQTLIGEKLRELEIHSNDRKPSSLQLVSKKPHPDSSAERINLDEHAKAKSSSFNEHLVPIRINLEFDNFKFKDTFTWNLYEKHITPELFAEILCRDFRFPASVIGPYIVKSIKEQLTEFGNYLGVIQGVKGNEEQQQTNELRIIIKLDITVGNMTLIDQLEWDIARYNQPSSFIEPEWVAELITAELGLVGEFKTAIAHSIREQIYWHIKSLVMSGYSLSDSFIDDLDLREAFLPPALPHGQRDPEQRDFFSPTMMQLSKEDLQRLEEESESSNRERDARRKRRLNRGRRVELWALRAPPKTQRTLLKRADHFSRLIQSATLASIPATLSSSINRKRQIYLPKSDPRLLLPAFGTLTGGGSTPNNTNSTIALISEESAATKCENCKASIPSGSSNSLCRECANYYRKNLTHRPSSLNNEIDEFFE